MEVKDMEINKGNITDIVQFSSRGLKDKKDEPLPAFTFHPEVGPDDVLEAIQGSIAKGISVKAEYVVEFLRSMPFTYQQLGAVVTACTEGMMRIKESGRWYYSGIYDMAQYRKLRKEAVLLFDTEINR